MKVRIISWASVTVAVAAAPWPGPKTTSFSPESILSPFPLKPTDPPRVAERQAEIPLNYCGYVEGDISEIHITKFLLRRLLIMVLFKGNPFGCASDSICNFYSTLVGCCTSPPCTSYYSECRGFYDSCDSQCSTNSWILKWWVP